MWEPVRVLLDDAHGVPAVALDDALRERAGHADAVEEHHHVLDVALVGEHFRDRRSACAADADHLGHPLRRLLDHVERVRAELLDDALRERRTNAGERLRAEELLDPRLGLRRDQLVLGDAKLLAPLAIGLPRAAQA